jgi:hypothetical protein
MKAPQASLLKRSGDAMPDVGGTAVSTVDMATEATVDAQIVPVVAVEAAVEAEVQSNCPEVKAVVDPAVDPVAETMVETAAVIAAKPAAEQRVRVAVGKSEDIVEFGYSVEGDVQYVDVTFEFCM